MFLVLEPRSSKGLRDSLVGVFVGVLFRVGHFGGVMVGGVTLLKDGGTVTSVLRGGLFGYVITRANYRGTVLGNK